MAERRKPIVTELALADALDQLVNLIEELRADADLRVQITTDETELVKLTFSGTPDVGFPLQREVRSISRRDRSPCLERGPAVLRDRIASSIGEQSLSRPSEQRFFRSSRTVEVHTATTRFRFRRFRTQQAPTRVNRCQQAYMAI